MPAHKNSGVYQRNRRKRISDIKKSIKSECGCADCGDKRWWVLCFHHIYNKSFEISDAGGLFGHKNGRKKVTIGSARYISKNSLLEEIAKCEVLCHNCHADRHYKEALNRTTNINSNRTWKNGKHEVYKNSRKQYMRLWRQKRRERRVLA